MGESLNQRDEPILNKVFDDRVAVYREPTAEEAWELLKENYELCHFIGHGVFNQEFPERSGWRFKEGGLLTCRQIQDLVTHHVFPRLIVANSCDSARSAETDAQAYVSTLYQAFLSKGVPHYIGTIARVPDDVSLTFSRSFYTTLAEGKTVGEALFQARQISQVGAGWGYYVHYGYPLDRVLQGEPIVPAAVTDVSSPPSFAKVSKETIWKNFAAVAFRHWRWMVGGLVGAMLLAALGWYLNWRAGTFRPDAFGIALARFEIKDLSRSSIQSYAEDLLSPEELAGQLVQIGNSPAVLEIKTSHRAFTSSGDARAWGAKRGASLVMWGTAERGSQGFIVHLKASRIRLPETVRRTETYRRFFVQKLFPEYFRDTETYATDFELGGVPIDLTNPAGMSMLGREAAEFARFCQGVLVYAEGKYPDAAKIFEQVASSNTTEDLQRLAKRWLVLNYLNSRNYAGAERTFAGLQDQKSISDEDRVRYAFLHAADRNMRGVIPWVDRKEEEQLWELLDSPGKLAPYPSITLAVILTNGWTGDTTAILDLLKEREEKRARFGLASLEEMLEQTVAALPEDYFLQYIRGMLSTNAAVSKEALEKAEQLQPQAAEPHFGRAIFLQTGDAEAALREIDAALARDPTQIAYRNTKWRVLEELQYGTLGSAHNAVRLQQVALAEEVLNKKYGPKVVRILFAEELAKAYVRLHKPAEAAAVLEKEAGELPDICKHAATISMREIGSLSLARKFFDCAFRQGWSGADQNLDLLWLEYQWRNGDYQATNDGFVDRVFRDRWKSDLGESLAVRDTVANILHADGRYDDAEKILRGAKDYASKMKADTRNFQVRDFTLPEKDRKWNWIASFDLGLALLSRQKYPQAAREFQYARDYLLKTPSCPACFTKDAKGKDVRESLYEASRDLAFKTEMGLGYTYFKQKDYESAARGWLAASRAASSPLSYIGFSNQQLLEKRVENDLRENLQRFMEDPEHPGQTRVQPEVIVDQMLLLHKYAEARTFMERYILSMGDQPNDEWTARLLVVFLQLRDLDRVEQLFMEFVRSHSGTLTSKATFAGLVTSLYPGVNSLYLGPGMLRTPNFFWDVISRNPYPE